MYANELLLELLTLLEILIQLLLPLIVLVLPHLLIQLPTSATTACVCTRARSVYSVWWLSKRPLPLQLPTSLHVAKLMVAGVVVGVVMVLVVVVVAVGVGCRKGGVDFQALAANCDLRCEWMHQA